MDIEDGQEDGDPLARAAHEVRLRGLVDHVHLAVAGRDDGLRILVREGLRVAEEVECEEDEENPEPDERGRDGDHKAAQHGGQLAGGKQRQQEDKRPEDDAECCFERLAGMFHVRGTLDEERGA